MKLIWRQCNDGDTLYAQIIKLCKTIAQQMLYSKLEIVIR